jgi:two-component system cell cycle response regulator CpdR
LSYRQVSDVPIRINVKQIIRQYRNLVKFLAVYFDKHEKVYGFGCNIQILADMLEEAILYADTGLEERFIRTVEVILSHAHKLLLDYAPKVRSAPRPDPPLQPLRLSAERELPEQVIADQKAVATKRILLVDDDPDIRRIMSHIAKSASRDLEVVEAESGVEALRKMVDETFDLLISDIVMPEVDGVELAKAVRKSSPNTRVILISGFKNLASVPDAAPVADFFLWKPFHTVGMQVAIRSALGLGGAKKPPRRRR